MNIESTIILNDGNNMPLFGLGVYQSERGVETQNAVYKALKAGYRQIDTAEIYKNEEDCGIGIEMFLTETGLSRDKLFITSKFFPMPNGKNKNDVKDALKKSLKKLKLDYLDLYLIHAPTDFENRLKEHWKALEELKDEGLVVSIGVSNYGIHHIQEILDSNYKYLPVTNQVELNPYITRTELVNFCNSKSIIMTAYSPLTKAIKLDDVKLISIATKYNKTTAQILIRWCLQKNYIVIPKSVNDVRIIENANVFDFNISNDDILLLDNFDEYLVTGWDPTIKP